MDAVECCCSRYCRRKVLGRKTPKILAACLHIHHQWKYCQIAICLTLQEAGPLITPALSLFFWYSQLLVENWMPRLISWLLTWPIFLLTSGLHAFGFCLVHSTNPFSGVCSSWILLLRMLTLLVDPLFFFVTETHPCRVASASHLRAI